MKSRKKYGILFVVLTLLLCTACSPIRSVPDYRSRAFFAKLAWVSEGVPVCAEIEAENAMDFTMTVLEPPSVRGLTYSCRDGQKKWCCDGIEWEGSAFGALSEYGALLFCDGSMKPICRAETVGEDVIYAEIQGGNEGTYELYLHEETGAPCRIGDGERVVEIREFRYLS